MRKEELNEDVNITIGRLRALIKYYVDPAKKQRMLDLLNKVSEDVMETEIALSRNSQTR